MTIIGSFKLTVDGSYNGEISTLTLNRKVRLVPTDAAGKNAPDLKVFIGLAEIGVAWQKTSRGGDRYFAVKLDDPSFAAPIWANLVESRQDVAVFNLLWDRPTRSAETGSGLTAGDAPLRRGASRWVTSDIPGRTGYRGRS